MPELQEYRRIVTECRKEQSTRILSNRSVSHALVLIENLIQLAIDKNRNIYMVSGEINKDFYNKLINNFKEFLDHPTNTNKRLSVIILNPDKIEKEGNLLFQLLSKNKSNEIKISGNNNKNIGKEHPHFFLVGQEAYRLEKDHEKGLATASFHDTVNGQFLLDLFDYTSSKSNKNSIYNI